MFSLFHTTLFPIPCCSHPIPCCSLPLQLGGGIGTGIPQVNTMGGLGGIFGGPAGGGLDVFSTGFKSTEFYTAPKLVRYKFGKKKKKKKDTILVRFYCFRCY